MLHKLIHPFAGRCRRYKKAAAPPPVKLNATVVLVKKNVLGFNDFNASLLDNVDEFLGKRVCFHLVSATAGQPSTISPPIPSFPPIFRLSVSGSDQASSPNPMSPPISFLHFRQVSTRIHRPIRLSSLLS